MKRICLSLLVGILAGINAFAGDFSLENGAIRLSVDSNGIITVVDQKSATKWKQAVPEEGKVYAVDSLSKKKN